MTLPTDSKWAEAKPINPTGSVIDFSYMIDLSTFDSEWWTEAEDTNARRGRAAFRSSGTVAEIAVDFIDYNHSAQTCRARVNVPGTISVLGATDAILIYPPKADNSITLTTDTYGKYNACDSYRAGYWPEGGGDDRTSSQNIGIAEPGSGVVAGGITGKVGNATAYDGVDDSYAIDPTLLPTGDDARTVSLWFRSTSTGNERVVCWGSVTSATAAAYRVCIENGELINRYYDGLSSWGDLSLDDGAWHQIVMLNPAPARSDNTVAYVDGVLIGSPTHSSSNVLNTGIVSGLLGADCQSPGEGSSLADLNEITIDSINRSADWIAYEYAQTNDQSAFYGTWTTKTPSSLTSSTSRPRVRSGERLR